MPIQPELAAIVAEVNRKFSPSNPIAQAIAEKLARTLYQQRRCECLLEYARSISTFKIDQLPADKQAAFRANVRKLLDKVKELKRASRDYSASLSTETIH